MFNYVPIEKNYGLLIAIRLKNGHNIKQDEIIFDSKLHNWNENKREFD